MVYDRECISVSISHSETKRGDTVLLKDFCKGIYSMCPAFTNHEDFLDGLCRAAGKVLSISKSYKRNLFSGSKPFIESQKTDLRGHDNQQPLEDFFYSNIADDKVIDVLLAFGVPEKHEPDKKALSTALALQMKALIDCSDDEEADDLILAVYQDAKATPHGVDTTIAAFKPLYMGDDVYVGANPPHKIQSHETVSHTWSIMNAGKVTWVGRKLVYCRGSKDRPEAQPSEIPIPTVKPNESTKITTTFDGRGFDGIFHCLWEMQDSDGENCFPKRDSLFSVTIDAKFKRR